LPFIAVSMQHNLKVALDDGTAAHTGRPRWGKGFLIVVAIGALIPIRGVAAVEVNLTGHTGSDHPLQPLPPFPSLGSIHSYVQGGSVPRTITLRNNPTMCLDIPGGHDQPASLIELWECNGNTNQLWLFDAGRWAIQYAADPTKCLDAGAAMTKGALVMLWNCNSLPQQKWGYDYKAGTIYLAGSDSDASLCLDAFQDQKAGNQLQLWDCNEYQQQQFNVNLGTTIRVNQDYEKCLDLEGGKAVDGGKVQIWPCNGLPNQQWIYWEDTRMIVYGGNGGNPAFCLDAGNEQLQSSLKIWTCNGYPQQKFGYDFTEFTVYLASSESDASKCLDLGGGDFSQGASVDVWTCNGCWNQKWILGAGASTTSAVATSFASSNTSGVAIGQPQVPYSCPPIGPAPAPGGPCVGGWPKFDSQAQLQANTWGSCYFKQVYGYVPDDASGFYPLCLGELWMFYTDVMQSCGVTGVPQSVGECPTNRGKTPGQYYQHMSGLQPNNVAWSWHPLPHVAIPDNTWVEVIHRKFVKDEHAGAWFFYARGGGIWFNMGKTISFQDHGGAYRYFKTGDKSNQEICKRGAAQGYDSIQFLFHSDAEFKRCRERPGQASMNYELVSTKLEGMYSCASQDGKSDLLRVGFHSKTCICDNSQEHLNCAGVPQLKEFVV